MTGLYHGWSSEDDSHADFVHGGVPVDDFEEPVRWKKKSQKVTPKKKPGCPGNDGKAHIYIWTTELNHDDLFYMYFGFHKTEKKVCAGCGKKVAGSRVTERYEKKFKATSCWSGPEYDHEGFREFRKKWMVQRGWTQEVYGNW